MKVCLSSRQSAEYLKLADEIKVEYRDRNSIPDLIERYPEATIILQVRETVDLPWKDFNTYNILSKKKFILCLASMENMLEAKKHDIKFYYGFSVYDYESLQVLKDIGVCYIKVEGSLFFDMTYIKRFDIPVRIIPNTSFDDGWPRDNGVAGTWVRPEDLAHYDEFMGGIAVEFEDCNVKKEQALYRVYIKDKKWPGQLGLVVSDLNYIGSNLLIPNDFWERRINCRQRCKRDNSCHYCYTILSMANSDLYKNLSQLQSDKE